ncbi:hypothetical protein BAUCODRAFT_20730 [Baudoinia panamericana UAMH 10762]|uniref:Uncharacterized protein n=1 Tax=Baudoinia panamericana (strain UAMH 10762) TaxID=717646 RepID=M2N937_BAUPA|nr:uncharacterized protein BAUCODRAFT_20730 [Baudoinia panamericana UAMH 10762]EMD00674.1 hypothetical protein BAUCODRAFT_20730 [Baudoinia panamericana UAMH 10762]
MHDTTAVGTPQAPVAAIDILTQAYETESELQKTLGRPLEYAVANGYDGSENHTITSDVEFNSRASVNKANKQRRLEVLAGGEMAQADGPAPPPINAGSRVQSGAQSVHHPAEWAVRRRCSRNTSTCNIRISCRQRGQLPAMWAMSPSSRLCEARIYPE